MKKIILIFMTACVFISTSALARNGVFLVLQTGWANQPSLPSAEFVAATSKNEPSFPSAYNIAIGYNHDFWKWLGFGLSVGFGRYGGTSYHFPTGTTTLVAHAVEFLTQTTYHINHKVDIFVTIGGIRHTGNITGFNSGKGRMRIQPEIGIGSNYNLNRHLALTGSYNRTIGKHLTLINGTEYAEPSLNEFLAGIRITFG